ncbi:MAG: dockerin type I domain-containing protein, partial [Candidatus Competibacterales bacterium]
MPSWGQINAIAQADVDGNGLVNIVDLSSVASCFARDPQQPPCQVADVDNDNDVDLDDINFIIARLGQTVAAFPTVTSPQLDPVAPITSRPTTVICGEASEQTRIRATGGAYPTSTEVDVAEQLFCLEIPLVQNARNSISITAIENADGAPLPRETATTTAVEVVQLNPIELILGDPDLIALSADEIALLVDEGIIADPGNSAVSLYWLPVTFDLTTITLEAILVEGPGPLQIAQGEGFSLLLQELPNHPPLAGVLLLTPISAELDELYSLTLALKNTTTQAHNTQLQLDLPLELSLVYPGIGEFDPHQALVALPTLQPGASRNEQLLISGDGVATAPLAITLTGQLDDNTPFGGNTSVTVNVAPPTPLTLAVSHPISNPGLDISAGEDYTLTLSLINHGALPIPFPNLDIQLGEGTALRDFAGLTLPDNSAAGALGLIGPGATATATLRLQALISGDISACGATQRGTALLAIDVGPVGAGCHTDETRPLATVAPNNATPKVVALSPRHGEVEVPTDAVISASLTPITNCFSSAPLQLERLDPLGQVVQPIPGTMVLNDGIDTTTATLVPDQLLLTNTRYQATLTGGCGNTRWQFVTVLPCEGVAQPSATLIQPLPDVGVIDPTTNIIFQFNNRLDP